MIERVPGMTAFVEANPNLCSWVDHQDRNCVIDGKNISHSLWQATHPDNALSDGPAYAAMTRNFFKTLLNNRITPHVCFFRGFSPKVTECVNGVRPFLAELILDRMCDAKLLADKKESSIPWRLFSMHGRIIFGEILEELQISSCHLKGWTTCCAQRLDAFLISGHSLRYFVSYPRGFVNTQWVNLRNPSPRMRTFYFERLQRAIGLCRGYRFNEHIVTQFLFLVNAYEKNESLKKFVNKYCRTDQWDHIVDLSCTARHISYSKYLAILNMLASMTADEALRFISASFYQLEESCLEDRKVVPIRESIYMLFNEAEEYWQEQKDPKAIYEPPIFEGWINLSESRPPAISRYAAPPVPSPRYIADSSSGYTSRDEDELSSHNVSISSGYGSDWLLGDALRTDYFDVCPNEESEEPQKMDTGTEMFPDWFIDIIVKENRYGERGAKLMSVFRCMSSGFFPCPYFLQDTEKLSSSFASLHIRKALYGIIFNEHPRRNTESNIYVQEIVNKNGLEGLFDCHVYPKWTVKNMDDMEDITLPGLHGVTALDLESRRNLFKIALEREDSLSHKWPLPWAVGRLSWTEEVARHFSCSSSTDFAASLYRLVVLKSWAMHSEELTKLHVIVLLLSVLVVEAKYGFLSGIFPWPIQIKPWRAFDRICDQFRLNTQLNMKLLHPFGQLQSVLTDARNLNFVLNHPFGARVDRIQMFLSEKIFYNLSECISEMKPDEAGVFIRDLFDDYSYGRFIQVVNMIFDPRERQGRQPLLIYSASDFKNVNFEVEFIVQMFEGK